MSIESRLEELERLVGALTEAQNDKVDLPVSVPQTNVDYVIESKLPTSSDPTWYRKYKNGWVEQGGTVTTTSGDSQTNILITFLKPFIDTNYVVYGSVASSVAYSSNTNTPTYNSITTRGIVINRKSPTGFYFDTIIKSDSSGAGDKNWVVCGIGA